MMERRLQRKFEWAELPAVFAEGLLRLHGAGIELAESIFSSDDTGTFTQCQLQIVIHGLDLKSSSKGHARLSGEVAHPLWVVKEEEVVLVVLVRRHCHAVGAAVRRAVDDEAPGAVEKETGQPRCAVCPHTFGMRCLYILLVRLASSL